MWSAADLGVDLGSGKVKVERYQELPKRVGQVELIEGATAQDKAGALVDKLIEEKVL